MKTDRKLIQIDTRTTSLVLSADERMRIVHYGRKLFGGDYKMLFGEETTHSDRNTSVSSFGEYDFREPCFLIRSQSGVFKSRFLFCEVKNGEEETDGKLPLAGSPEKTVVIVYSDEVSGVTLKQFISVYRGTDAMTSRFAIENTSGAPVTIGRAMSFQLDLWGDEFCLTSYTGNWGRERKRTDEKLAVGIHICDSKCGVSSSFCNPYVTLKNTRTGEVFGFNLIYTGNHKEIVEVTPNGNARILVGMNDFAFSKTLAPGETFYTPQCVFCHAETEESLSARMHSFVENHISVGKLSKAPRPVVFNVWEAMYFDFDTEKALRLADLAAAAGMEVFVLDDGWFGKRKDDTSSLGDWTENREKFPSGLARFADEIRAKGLGFGLWVEPEAVSPDSDLYREHPDWAMKIPGVKPFLQRNELLLDLSRKDVQDYLIKSICSIIDLCRAEYVKWDFNRLFTDPGGAGGTDEDYFHSYIIGLYRVIGEIVSSHEDVLFESCSSGGARYDLGLLSFMPQVWTSDNTDARDRLSIQRGTLAGYPASTMGAHVSICPNHQTGNSTSIENRFNVASCGLLGYEMDLTAVTEEELGVISEQIAYYKKHRMLFQYGKTISFGDEKKGGWIKIGERGDAIAFVFLSGRSLCENASRFAFPGLEDEKMYDVEMRPQANVEKTIRFRASGSLLSCGNLSFGNLFDAETDRKENSNSIATRLFYIRPVGENT